MIKLKKLDNQKGVVSFFTVIFVTMLLLILTTAYIRLMVNEQRQATDNDLSSRAFYAAETGVNDAIIKIKQALEAGDLSSISTNTCGDEKELSADADISYTCQFISLNTNKIKGSLEQDQTLVLDLTDVAAVEKIEVQWHEPDRDAEGDAPFSGAVTSLNAGQNLSNWTSDIPAIMRLQAITFGNTNITRANIINKISFGYPTISGSGVFGGDLDINEKKGPATGSVCANNRPRDKFACKITFTDLGTKPNKFLRLQAINNGAEYELSLKNKFGTTIAIPNQVATIDVTGKAGSDVFRRVRVTVPINTNGGPSNSALLPDQVLVVNQDICKDFEVSDSGNGVAKTFNCNIEN